MESRADVPDDVRNPVRQIIMGPGGGGGGGGRLIMMMLS